MENKLTFLGHASFKIISALNTVIYIDPSFPCKGYQEEADLILISHHHSDHDKTELVNKKPECLILGPSDFIMNDKYLSREFKDLKITAVAAYNKNHKKSESIGFVLEFKDAKVYIAGDTSKTTEMADMAYLGIDYAFLPIDGFYNMDVKEAEKCIDIIKAKHFIPIHNDSRSSSDGKEYTTHFDELTKDNVIIMHHGETIEI